MSRSIFLLQNDSTLIEMREQVYDSEVVLQKLLASYPDLMPGEQIDPNQPRRWLLITREASVPAEEGGGGRWSADHLFLDQDAIPTIVEVKRSSDTRIRREVVGQMLDYAANSVAYWSVESLRAQFEKFCQVRGMDAEQEVADFLGGASEAEGFWQKVKTNLQAGKLRLVFVADIIPVELKRIVEFLNEQMDPAEVLAVEIKQYTGEGLKTLVPNVLGLTAEAQQRKASVSSNQKQWDEASFFEELKKKGLEEAAAARRILDWSRPPRITYIWWGKGQLTGAYVPILLYKGTHHQLFAVRTSGVIELYFAIYKRKQPFIEEGRRLDLLHRLNSIPGISISPDKVSLYPNIPLKVLSDEATLNQFFEVFQWFIDEIKAT